MTLSALIKKGGLTTVMTATAATIATQEADNPVTVASVATVAVAGMPGPILELSYDDESSIRAWLMHIGEIDPVIRDEVLDRCRNDLDARLYFLKLLDEVRSHITKNNTIRCGDCKHFMRIDHPNLGHCAKNMPEAVAGLWDTDRRYCERFVSSFDATLSCY